VYNKLFAKILDSSIWLEDHATVRVWITFMAVMDEDGFCPFSSPTNLAKRAGVTLSEARIALDKLEAPDEFSSDPEYEGRRVERTSGGWFVLNAEKYRHAVTRDEIRRQNRERAQKYRERKKGAVTQKRDEVTQKRDSVTQKRDDIANRHASVTQSVSVSVSNQNQEQKQVHTASARKDAKKFAASTRQMLDDLSDDSLGDLALEIACRHPRSRLRGWTPRNVGQADTVAILDAMEDEARQTGVTMAEAGRMMLALLDAWDEVPRERWQYVAAIPKFYKQGDYRLEPKELPGINPQEGKAYGKRRGTDGNAEALQEFLAEGTRGNDGDSAVAQGSHRLLHDAPGDGTGPEDEPGVAQGLHGISGGSGAGGDYSGVQPSAGRAQVLSAARYPPRIQWPRRNG
jgi:hypothetical protein